MVLSEPPKPIAVVPKDSSLGTDPEETGAILINALNEQIRKTLVYAKTLKLVLLRTEAGGRRKEAYCCGCNKQRAAEKRSHIGLNAPERPVSLQMQ
ncbi:MAG TPA: hypothetical protein VF730_13230 [Terracidiphilus sp.]